MGADIHGYIEVMQGGVWYAKIDLDTLIERDYDFFGSMFGVRNYTGIKPVFERRGLPQDTSYEVDYDYRENEDYHSYSYATLEELKNIDLSKKGTKHDERIREYEIKDDQEVFLCKFSYSSMIEQYMDEINSVGFKKIGNKIYRKEYMDIKEAAGERLSIIIDVMNALCKYYEDVRIVVYFDN